MAAVCRNGCVPASAREAAYRSAVTEAIYDGAKKTKMRQAHDAAGDDTARGEAGSGGGVRACRDSPCSLPNA